MNVFIFAIVKIFSFIDSRVQWRITFSPEENIFTIAVIRIHCLNNIVLNQATVITTITRDCAKSKFKILCPGTPNIFSCGTTVNRDNGND